MPKAISATKNRHPATHQMKRKKAINEEKQKFKQIRTT